MYALNSTRVFRDWLDQLKNVQAKVAVLRRIGRAEQGNFGDHKPVGEGVYEMRIPVGAGYRVYYTQTGEVVYLLLVGGDKSSQARDIAAAKQMAAAIRSGS